MRGIVLGILTCLLAGCATGRNAMRDCQGALVATVRNNWMQPVDVYVEVDGRSGFILGEVIPGDRQEFNLPQGASRLYYRWRSGYAGPPPTSSDISTSYACR